MAPLSSPNIIELIHLRYQMIRKNKDLKNKKKKQTYKVVSYLS